MIKSYKKPPVKWLNVMTSHRALNFYSQYAGLPLYRCEVDIDVETAISSVDVTFNGTTYTFTFDEPITKGSLNVLTGVLTKADSSTYAMGGIELETILGRNVLSDNINNDLYVKYITAGR